LNDLKKMIETVINENREALENISEEDICRYLEMIIQAKRVFFVGVGRVLLSLEAIAKRYAHLGIDTVIVGQITEPAITAEDVLIVGSGSGETFFPLGIAEKAGEIGASVIHIGSNPDSSMRQYADLFLRIPVASRANKRDEIRSRQPMTSLFEQALLLFGDVTALLMIQKEQINLEDLWLCHANLE